jgi:hypothetical protein
MQSVPIATKVTSSTPCKWESLQHYLIKFVSDIHMISSVFSDLSTYPPPQTIPLSEM